jgi:predicted YcjX-like family ATPase
VDAPFFPLPAAALGRRPDLARRLRRAYDRYAGGVVRPFFNRIAACHHQVVLVAVLDVLRSGPARHHEVRGQLGRVLHLFRMLQPGFFGRNLWGGASLRHVTFCATKADQATRDGRPNLVALLKMLVGQSAAGLEIQLNVGEPRFVAVSAHRCTEDVPADHEGKQFLALRGRLRAGDGDQLIYPGAVPESWPVRADGWARFPFPDFAPREMPVVATGQPLPHIGMDQVMYRLVEEVLA